MKLRRFSFVLSIIVFLIIGGVPVFARNISGNFTYPIASANLKFKLGYGVQNSSLKGRNSCYWDASTQAYVPFNQLWHTGEDWFSNLPADKTPILAVGNGIVVYVSPAGYSYPGAVIIIDHLLSDYQTHIYSMYGHLDPNKLLVKVNDRVAFGQEIAGGLLKQTYEGGDNTHLHWEMRYFFDGSGITKGPDYTQSCSAEPGPGYTWPGQPDNFVFNGTTYHWTNPSQFVAAHFSSIVIRTIAASATQFGTPWDVAVDKQGYVVTDSQNGSLLQVSSKGDITTIASGFGRLFGVATDGSSFIVNDGNGNLLRVYQNGTNSIIASSVITPNFAASIAVDGSDFILTDYVNGQLLRVNPQGSVSVIATGLPYASGVLIGSNDYIVAGRNNNVSSPEATLYRVSRDGTVSIITSQSPSEGNSLFASVAMIGSDFYVFDDFGNIARITPDGTITTIVYNYLLPGQSLNLVSNGEDLVVTSFSNVSSLIDISGVVNTPQMIC